jgi:hypothetical protein
MRSYTVERAREGVLSFAVLEAKMGESSQNLHHPCRPVLQEAAGRSEDPLSSSLKFEALCKPLKRNTVML